MTIFACIKDGRVLAQLTVIDPPDGVGPPRPTGVEDEYDSVMVIPELIQRPPGSSSETYLFWNEGTPDWVDLRALDQARADKIAEMSKFCGEHIVAGFTSSALGIEYLYPAKPQDQANLIASVTDSLLAGGAVDWTTPFWCADALGDWQFRPHTIAQIQQVGREGKAATLAAMSRNEQLRRQIEVTAAADLPGIVWSMP